MRRQGNETPTPASVSASGQTTGVDAGKDTTLPARVQLTPEDEALDAAARAWSAWLCRVYTQADASAESYSGRPK